MAEVYVLRSHFPDVKGISPVGSSYDGGKLNPTTSASSEIKLPLKNSDVYYIIAGTDAYKSMEIIRVKDLICSKFCISSERGKKLYESIRSGLLRGKKIHIFFGGITDISSAFLDSAIGELYNGEFSKDELKEKISIRGLAHEDLFILGRVTERARDFFENPKNIESLFEHDTY